MPPPSDIAAALGQQPDLAGVRLVYFDEVTSTNDVAVELAGSGAVDRTTVLAGAQSSGRGRRGHSWHSPGGAGLYMSILLLGRQLPLVTLMAGVAVAEAVAHRSGVAVELKWPNDVVVPAPRIPTGAVGPSRKVAGILAERLPLAVGEGVVMGIGINVGRADYPAELGGRATSLEAEARAPVRSAALLADVLSGVERWRRALAAHGSTDLLARWCSLSPSSHGASVTWDEGGARRAGVTAGIDAEGALRVDCEGRTERIVGGVVTWEGSSPQALRPQP